MRDVNVDGKIILDYHIGPNAGQSLFRVTSATSKSFTFFTYILSTSYQVTQSRV
jgi:hypothetical protein